jgi:hypothetical protein
MAGALSLEARRVTVGAVILMGRLRPILRTLLLGLADCGDGGGYPPSMQTNFDNIAGLQHRIA